MQVTIVGTQFPSSSCTSRKNYSQISTFNFPLTSRWSSSFLPFLLGAMYKIKWQTNWVWRKLLLLYLLSMFNHVNWWFAKCFPDYDINKPSEKTLAMWATNETNLCILSTSYNITKYQNTICNASHSLFLHLYLFIFRWDLLPGGQLSLIWDSCKTVPLWQLNMEIIFSIQNANAIFFDNPFWY